MAFYEEKEEVPYVDRTRIFWISGSILPHVYLVLEEQPVLFVVDTGSQSTSVTVEQFKALGFKESDASHPEHEFSLGFAYMYFDFGENEMKFPVRVRKNRHNLLGLDFLKMFCCVIDLDNEELIMREVVRGWNFDLPKTIVNIQGKDVEMEIDTGSEVYIIGPMSLAKELCLPLRETVHGERIHANFFDASVKYKATDLHIKAFGREARNA